MVTNGSAEKYWARLEDKVKIFGVELRERQINSETKTFEPEVALIGQNQTKTLVLPQSWMEAWIVVTEHPYYAVSNEVGEFELTDIPPGQYTLRVWHETLGQFEQPVEVKANTEASVEFVLSERGRSPGAN